MRFILIQNKNGEYRIFLLLKSLAIFHFWKLQQKISKKTTESELVERLSVNKDTVRLYSKVYRASS